ncbi:MULTISPECIES: hypothetical protein [Dickeya]|uniref:hypothetical protein n=1 Tax=Dickeya TaxID=204037 RepID=UPI00031F399F|nr:MULTISPECIES: hypothetical protein [Dickeya]
MKRIQYHHYGVPEIIRREGVKSVQLRDAIPLITLLDTGCKPGGKGVVAMD